MSRFRSADIVSEFSFSTMVVQSGELMMGTGISGVRASYIPRMGIMIGNLIMRSRRSKL